MRNTIRWETAKFVLTALSNAKSLSFSLQPSSTQHFHQSYIIMNNKNEIPSMATNLIAFVLNISLSCQSNGDFPILIGTFKSHIKRPTFYQLFDYLVTSNKDKCQRLSCTTDHC